MAANSLNSQTLFLLDLLCACSVSLKALKTKTLALYSFPLSKFSSDIGAERKMGNTQALNMVCVTGMLVILYMVKAADS